MRITKKHKIFNYILPCQNETGYGQAGEIQLGGTEYTAKKYIVGSAINKLGELEDVLEKYGIENLGEYISALIEARNFVIKKRNTNFSKYIKETIKIENLEQELAELKQKAIVPKFQVGQEVYIVCYPNRIVTGWKITDYEYYKQQYIVECKGGIDWIHKDRIFATREEAEKKLTETEKNDVKN